MLTCECGNTVEQIPTICDVCGRWVDESLDDQERVGARPWCFTKRAFLNELLTVDWSQMNDILLAIATLVTSGPDPGDTSLAVPGYTPLAQRRIGPYSLVYVPPAPPATDVPTLVGISRVDAPRPRVSMSEKTVPRGVFDRALLFQLRLEPKYHDQVLAISTLEQLVRIELREDQRTMLFDVAVEPDWRQRISSRDYVVESSTELDQYVADQDYLEFSLRLDPDQERLVERILHGDGPFVIRGAPGTGKTTMALYGIKRMVTRLLENELLKIGERAKAPILYATFTATLRDSAKQQLQLLLGDNASQIEVSTVDQVVWSILHRWRLKFNEEPSLYQVPPEIEVVEDDGRAAMGQAMTSAGFIGDQQRIDQQQRAITRLGQDFLLQEVERFIAGRNITTLEDYLAADRTGRGIGLNAIQREAVWRVGQEFRWTLESQALTTWGDRRRWASTADITLFPRYKAVFVDEAQDLDPVATQLLFNCCPNKTRFFITADANQTIYNSGFRWADSGVWADPDESPRTYTLKTNHRTTRQIERATRAYINTGSGVMDDGFGETVVRNASRVQREMEGSLPRHCQYRFGPDMAPRLAGSIKHATQRHRIGYGLCAVLVPTHEKGKHVAEWLNNENVPAKFMYRETLDLNARVVKVITLHSSKGLEFPFVVITGFDGDRYQGLPTVTTAVGQIEQQAVDEAVSRIRRSIYVGMTRATRELLVITPPDPTALIERLFAGLSEDLWAPCGSQS